MSTASVVRNKVVRCLGTPNLTVGSVNEPREQEEHGARFNEKWVYKLSQAAPDQPKERIIYWLRYDFVGSYLVAPTGVATPENLAAELAGVDDRRYLPR